MGPSVLGSEEPGHQPPGSADTGSGSGKPGRECSVRHYALSCEGAEAISASDDEAQIDNYHVVYSDCETPCGSRD